MRNLRFISICIYTIACTAICGALQCCSPKRNNPTSLVAQANNLYQQAAKAQSSGDYYKAKALYDKLLHTTSNDETTNDSLLPIASKAVTQIMNTYQSLGEPEECVAYLKKLKSSKHVITGNMCHRDISVILAYALSRTEAVDEAAKEMDYALKQQPVNPTPDRLFRDYAYATAVYFCLPARKDEVNKYGSMALQQIMKCENKSGESWITSLLGMAYMRNGELGNALNIFKQSYTNASLRGDTLSMANTLNLMANVMINWNLYDFANEYASRAVAISDKVKDKNPKVCSNILTNKALVMIKFGYADSAAIYLERAYKFTKDLPYNSGNSDIDLVRGQMLTHNMATRNEGLHILRKVAANATSGIKTKAYYQLAQELIETGDNSAGEAALDSTIKTMSINTSPILKNNIYEYALDHYVTVGNKDKIVALAQDLNNSNRIVSSSDILKQTAESVVEFKTHERSEELDMQQLQIEHNKKAIAIYTIVVLIVLIAITAFLLTKRRYAMLRQKYAEQQLENLSLKLETMAHEKQQLSDMLKSHEEERPSLSLTKIQDKECEQRFRQTFQQLHPKFIGNLRKAVDGISRREELLAMLIALELDNSQIENIMCIARSSVNMARYRLRSKMQLSRDASLEDEIKKIIDAN